MKTLSLKTIAVCSLLIPGAAFATLIAHEDFGTGTGTLAGGGTGWAADWTTAFGSGGNYGTGTTFTGANIYAHQTDTHGFIGSNGNRVGRNIDTSGSSAAFAAGLVDGNGNIGVDGMSVYIGFGMRANAGGNPPVHYNGFEMHRDGEQDGQRHLQISSEGASNGPWQLRSDSNANLAPIAAADANANYWVLRLDFGASDVDTASVYLNPTLNAAEGAPTAQITGTDMSFDRVTFAEFGVNNFVDFDDIRVGTTYADVVGMVIPEPSTWALLAFGGLALVGRNRKR